MNNLLETLDGTAETVAENVVTTVTGGYDVGGDGSDVDEDDVDEDIDVDVDVEEDVNVEEDDDDDDVVDKGDNGGYDRATATTAAAFKQLLASGREAVLTNASRMGIHPINDENNVNVDVNVNDEYDEFSTDDEYEYDEITTDDDDDEDRGNLLKEETAKVVVDEEDAAVVTTKQTPQQRQNVHVHASAVGSGEPLESIIYDKGFDGTIPSTYPRLETLQSNAGRTDLPGHGQHYSSNNNTMAGITDHTDHEQDEEAMSIEGRRPAESVSDLSFSDAALGDDVISNDCHDGTENDGENDVDVDVGVAIHDDDDDDDTKNKTENGDGGEGGRDLTGNVVTGMGQSSRAAVTRSLVPSPTLPHAASVTGTTATSTRLVGSPKVDQSPRQPHRTVESSSNSMGLLKGNLPVLLDVSFHHQESEPTSTTTSAAAIDFGPPRLPKRQSSSRQDVQLTDAITPELNDNRQSSSVLPATVIPLTQDNPTKKVALQSLQSQLAKAQKELAAAESKNRKLLQRVNQMDEKLQTSEAEVEAQAKELDRAGNELEQIRIKAKLEQEELMDEHDEELDDLQKEHQSALDTMRQQYEKTIAEWKEQYELEQARRQQEGGDWTNELEEAIQREKDALKRLYEIDTERTNLQSMHEKLLSQHEALQQELDSERLSSKAALEREREAHNKLDEALVLHSKQISQRQRREAELEQQVLELGGALTLAQQQRLVSSQPQPPRLLSGSETGNTSFAVGADEDSLNFKEKWEQASEELVSTHVQLAMETQRRETLQRELQDIAQERAEEASLNQAQQLQHDQKVADFEATIMRLQSNLRTFQQGGTSTPTGTVTDGQARPNKETMWNKVSTQELEDSKREIRGLSEQLLRHQGLVENAKSEILALKGRLQAATARAEEAEKTLFSQSQIVPNSRNSNSGRIYDIEGGDIGIGSNDVALRRRIKGGNRARNGVRSIRSALNLGPVRGANPALDQIGVTIDAIDSWMVDTGSFMRHEPLARFGFLLYLVTLHVYFTVVVVFHTTEIEHGDFGSLDSNPRHWREHT